MQAGPRLETTEASQPSSVRRSGRAAPHWQCQFAATRDRCGLARGFAGPPRPRWSSHPAKSAGRKPKRSSLDHLIRCVAIARKPVKLQRRAPPGEKTRFGTGVRSLPIVPFDDAQPRTALFPCVCSYVLSCREFHFRGRPAHLAGQYRVTRNSLRQENCQERSRNIVLKSPPDEPALLFP